MIEWLALLFAAPAAVPPPGTPYFVYGGCTLGWVFFESGSFKLEGEALASISNLPPIDAARLYPMRLALYATTDPSGPALSNLRLSRKRALAVREWFVARGIPAARIRVEAHGERDFSGWGDELEARRSVQVVTEGPVVRRNQPGVPEVVC